MTSAPDGSSPRGYSRKHVLSIGSVNFPSFICHIAARLIISSGARPTLPMEVAPEAIVEYFWV
jgi:hypothetical protein